MYVYPNIYIYIYRLGYTLLGIPLGFLISRIYMYICTWCLQ